MSNATAQAAQDLFPITAAQLSGNFCEALFYGIYLVSCTFCCRILLFTGHGREERWRRFHEIRWMMSIIAFILFVICTFAVAMGLVRNFHAFVNSPNAEKELLNVKDWTNIARSANQAVAMILGDFVLIYRCWIVYGGQWLVISPSLILYLGNLAVVGKLAEVQATSGGESSLNSTRLRPWFLAFFATTAAQNILTTSILIWRIWRVEKQSAIFTDYSGSTVGKARYLRRVIRIIAESGAAYTAFVFATVIVSSTKSNALYPTADMTLQMTGIAFNAILIRSSPVRDKQFTLFVDEGRTAVRDSVNGAFGSTIIFEGAAAFNQQTISEATELTGVKSQGKTAEPSSQDVAYPQGSGKIMRTIVGP